MSVVDSDNLRQVLGQFATGVCVVTGVDREGRPIGMTINSFNSVSLDPPLVLWSVGNQAAEYEVFCQAERFAIHILDQSQAELSNHFATPADNKFLPSIATELSPHGVPVLTDAMCCLHCEAEHSYPAGDHHILVGRVVRIDRRESATAELPLLYFASNYRAIGGVIGDS